MGMSRGVILSTLAGALVVAAIGVPGCAEEPGKTPIVARQPAPVAKEDSSREAYAVAEKAVKAKAADAVLVSGGTQGVALADVPSSWSFYFVSPGQKKVFQVVVDHGKPEPVQEFGEARAQLDYEGATAFGSIKVAGAEAVEKARAFGEESGAVPQNVIVTGIFLDMAGAEGTGAAPGSWTITFTQGTDLEGARVFTVDMETGEVNEVKQ